MTLIPRVYRTVVKIANFQNQLIKDFKGLAKEFILKQERNREYENKTLVEILKTLFDEA